MFKSFPLSAAAQEVPVSVRFTLLFTKSPKAASHSSVFIIRVWYSTQIPLFPRTDVNIELFPKAQ